MTATALPFGLTPARKLGQNKNSEGVSTYRIVNAFAGNIFTGDLVRLNVVNGTITAVSASTNMGIGVFLGCQYNDPSNNNRPRFNTYWPTGTSVSDGSQPVAFVADDPWQTFYVQADASVSVGDIGRFFSVSVSAGNTTTGQSRYSLNAVSRALDKKHLQMIDIKDIPGNVLSDAFPIVEVKIGDHFWLGTSVV